MRAKGAKGIPLPSAANGAESMASTADQPFFGLWSNRKDLTDPESYVRKLREKRAYPYEEAKRTVQSDSAH